MYKVLVKKQTTFVNLYEDDNTDKNSTGREWPYNPNAIILWIRKKTLLQYNFTLDKSLESS